MIHDSIMIICIEAFRNNGRWNAEAFRKFSRQCLVKWHKWR
jgi:hypothetical protein